MKKNLEKVLIFLFSVLISISFSSCQIGLGSALDLESPEVEILTPLPRESVPGLFNITGTVKDNDSVVKLIVSLDSCTWIWSNNTWTLNGNECKDAEMIQNGKGSYNWKIKNAQIESDGEYTIKVNAYDLPQNASEKSVATRTVVYDKMAPKVSITYPALYQTEDAIKKELDSYSGDTGYQNYSIIDKFINGKFTVTGNQEEAFTLKYLRLYIYDGGAEVWKSPLYVSKESYIDDVIADGFFTSAEKSAQCYTVTSAIRSFSFDVPKLMNITGKKYLKVVTVSSDA